MTWEERMAAKYAAKQTVKQAEDNSWLVARNGYLYPRRRAVEAANEGCPERPSCYEARPDGETGRWLAFHIGSLENCKCEHHKTEVWIA